MDLTAPEPDGWETQAQVDEVRGALGLTPNQITRWRREGLLPDVMQVQDPYHGSLVHYPLGTCRQVEAVARLFKVKNRSRYVGWQLWWEGYPVDEKNWRPRLEKSARLFDQGLGRLLQYLERDEQKPGKRTLQERMARSSVTNLVISRIRGRQSGAALATTFATILNVASGTFEQFSLSDASEGKNADKARTIEAMDLDASETDTILGHRLNLVPELPNVFSAMSKALPGGGLSTVMTFPEQLVFRARDDVRNAFRIAVAHYDATKWIYGPAAFGLRLAAWIGRKQPDWLMPMIILGFAKLRQTSNQFMPSEQIAGLALQAEDNARLSVQLKSLAESDRQFRRVLSPKRIRAAFQDKPALARLIKDVEVVSQSISDAKSG